MNKSIEALKLGYVLFDVNGKKFLTYNKALKYSDSLKGKDSQCFQGFNVRSKRWESFYMEVAFNEPPLEIQFERCKLYYYKLKDKR